MGKKSTWIAVSAAALLIAGIAFALSRLYSTPTAVKPASVSADWDVLRAVPSDAVAVFVFDGSRAARNLIADSTGFLKPVIAAENPAIMDYLAAVGANRTAVALQSSGALVPLVLSKTDKADSASLASYISAAEKAGLKTEVKENFLIASRSETFIGASVRHLEEGSSVLSPAVMELTSLVDGPLVVFLSHSHAGKLLQQYSTPKYRKQAAFAKALTPWSAFSASVSKDGGIVLKGAAVAGEAADSYFAAFKGTAAGESLFPEVLPYNACSVVSVPVDGNTLQHRRSFEDGRGKLARLEKSLRDKAGRELSPEQWFLSLQAKEAVKLSFRGEDGVEHQAILIRSDKDHKIAKESKNAYPGVLGLALGEPFQIVDSVYQAVNARWTLFGDKPSVLAFATGEYPLKERLQDADIVAPEGFVAYASFSDEPAIIDNLFAPGLAKAVKEYAQGSGFVPAFASADLSGERPSFKVTLDKRALRGTKVQVMERDTTVEVPTGLFPVKNFSTGKTNYLYQNASGYICLNDENGKGLWGAPFKEKLCGRVQNIDYFNNGKIQFLFAAGTKLYAIDRLGHWVNGFPVQLGKAVLLGPDVYDFTGAGGYTVMILHKDNTLERYNLHGAKPDGWKGIKAPETVKNLPELLEIQDKKYWIVRTSIQTLIYPFAGGEPLAKGEGGKMIKPDAAITPSGKNVKAECYDGKIRDFKLN